MIARLARWLGPWTDQSRRPEVRRTELRVTGREPLRMWRYRPRGHAPAGALLVIPGLHFLGPADPRLDRFLAVLADSGVDVFAPFLPEFRRLSVGPSLVDDALAALDAARAEHPRLGVFSISFGSYPAIHCAIRRPDAVRALTLFGGYASFEDAIRFSLEGNVDRAHDPLNRPVVFLNLLDHLPGLPADRAPLREAWMTYVRLTWGRPWMKERAHWSEVSARVAATLPEPYRPMFRVGTGAAEGGHEAVEAALATGRESLSHLDLTAPCAAVRCPTTIVHGRDDDVIPHTHATMLAEALPPAAQPRVLLTGLYGHTAAGAVDLSAIRGELASMIGILEAIADGAMGVSEAV